MFKTISSLQDAVNEQEHTVKGKKVAVKKAKAKEGKIYVGKLKPELQCMMLFDPMSSRSQERLEMALLDKSAKTKEQLEICGN